MESAAKAIFDWEVAPMMFGSDPRSDERERERQALLRHVQLLHEAQHLAHMGSWSWDVASDSVAWSPHLFRIVGADPATFVPTYETFLHLIHEDDVDRVRAVHEESLLTGEPLSFVARIQRPDGDVRWIKSTAAPSIVDGHVAGMVGSVLDVTDRQHAEVALRDSEQRYRLMVETAQEGIWTIDDTGHTTFANEQMAQILGCSVEDLMARSVGDFIPVGDRETAAGILQRLREGIGQQCDVPLMQLDGPEVWVLMGASAIYDGDGRYAGALAMMTDITARKVAEADLLRSEGQLNAAQRLLKAGSFDRDLMKGTLRWSEEYVRMLGLPPGSEPSFEALLGVCHPDDRDKVAELRARVEAGGNERGEFRVVRPDGSIRVLTLVMEAGLDRNGMTVRFTGTAQDITDQRRLEEQLKQQALQDALTGLPNRALFVDRLEHALHRRERTGENVSLLFIDLDDFKTVNDSLGHGAGDDILVGVARRLQATVRPMDTAARFGGDEFAVLLEAAGECEAEGAAERILRALRLPFHGEGREVLVQASVGIAVASDGIEAEQLLRDADAAMYAAKRQQKRHRYRVFQPSMHTAARDLRELRADLEKAVEQHEFEVYYQPLVRMEDHGIVGVEALVRWHHPDRGLIPPLEFIPLAEESGLIVAIGAEVLQDATRWVQRVNRERGAQPLYVSVNLSPRQLAEGDFLDIVDDALQTSGLPAEYLVLEVTESVLVGDGGTVVPVLSKLRQRGVKVAVDDFGTGYSSLGYLRRLPVDILKVDRAFVTGVADSVEDSAVAQAVISLARVLGLSTVAEGIETPEQAAALLAIGCDFGQGYLFSRPVPGPELEGRLSTVPARGGHR